MTITHHLAHWVSFFTGMVLSSGLILDGEAPLEALMSAVKCEAQRIDGI